MKGKCSVKQIAPTGRKPFASLKCFYLSFYKKMFNVSGKYIPVAVYLGTMFGPDHTLLQWVSRPGVWGGQRKFSPAQPMGEGSYLIYVGGIFRQMYTSSESLCIICLEHILFAVNSYIFMLQYVA